MPSCRQKILRLEFTRNYKCRSFPGRDQIEKNFGISRVRTYHVASLSVRSPEIGKKRQFVLPSVIGNRNFISYALWDLANTGDAGLANPCDSENSIRLLA